VCKRNYLKFPVRTKLLIGWLAAIGGVLIGAGWQLSVRATLINTLTPADVLLLRYSIPAMILSPLLWRQGFVPKGIARNNLLAAIAFGGLLYGLFAVTGANFAPVAHMGALIPGTIPLFVALLIWPFYKQRPNVKTAFGLSMLLVGVAAVASNGQLRFEGPSLLGDLLFLAAALAWAGYTVAMRGQTVSVWHLSAVISFWSAIGAAILWSVVPGSRIAIASPLEIGSVILIQGVLAGIFGNALFLICVKHLGPVVAAGSGAIVPVLTALGGYLLLHESLSAVAAYGIASIVLGIWIVQVWARRTK
jgi:drug/metabolite transporter (DMT)-like permease